MQIFSLIQNPKMESTVQVLWTGLDWAAIPGKKSLSNQWIILTVDQFIYSSRTWSFICKKTASGPSTTASTTTSTQTTSPPDNPRQCLIHTRESCRLEALTPIISFPMSNSDINRCQSVCHGDYKDECQFIIFKANGNICSLYADNLNDVAASCTNIVRPATPSIKFCQNAFPDCQVNLMFFSIYSYENDLSRNISFQRQPLEMNVSELIVVWVLLKMSKAFKPVRSCATSPKTAAMWITTAIRWPARCTPKDVELLCPRPLPPSKNVLIGIWSVGTMNNDGAVMILYWFCHEALNRSPRPSPIT